MNGLIIDNFAGGGGASTGIEAALGRMVDIAINHDEQAIRMHEVNHPGTVHIRNNIWQVDPLEATGGKPVDLAWFSPDCFIAGTMILTDTGYRPIETVREGDMVLTHTGRYCRVYATMVADKPLIAVRVQGVPTIRTTAEHPFYTRAASNTWDNASRRYRRNLGAGRWTMASDLKFDGAPMNAVGGLLDFCATPCAFPVLDIPVIEGRGMAIDTRLLWLAGRYVGDGWTRLTGDRAELVITCGKHEADGLAEKLNVWPRTAARSQVNELAWHRRDTATAHQITTSHRGLVEWLRAEFGHGAEAKRLPAWLLGAGRDLREAFLEGYRSADGSEFVVAGVDLRETITISRALAFSIKALVEGLGYPAQVSEPRANSTVIEGRSVNSKPSYMVRWRLNPKRSQTERDHLHSWARVQGVESAETWATVYNISVEDDESYIADGIVVHNCKHFSKAKGGKPREKSIRDLAWVVVHWVKRLQDAARRGGDPDWRKIIKLICIENVEEFQTWGPLCDEGKPIKERAGETFRQWCAELRKRGGKIEFRELRACDYGAPTIRKRFFMVVRFDGLPIRWPEPTHGKPGSPEVLAGKRLPWRTAAEIIDWSIPCPSIFERQKPLAEKTLRRIAHGIMKFVVNNPAPFIVPLTHHGAPGRSYGSDQPLPTVTGANRGEMAVVSPVVVGTAFKNTRAARAFDPQDPLRTMTAQPEYGVAAAHLAPFATYAQQGGANRTVEDPLHTVTASRKDQNCIAAAHLVHIGNGEREGQAPRAMDVDKPLGTVVGSPKHHVVAAFMQKFAQNGQGYEPTDPLHTVMAGAPRHAVVCAHIEQANGGPNNANLAGRAADEPLSTATASGSQQRLVTSNLIKLRGTSDAHLEASAAGVDEPLGTISAGGTHAAEVRAFLIKYYGNEQDGHGLESPLGTVTVQDRFGLITVQIAGEEYVIVDIGMRMLTPRELFNAQGFPADYIIDRDATGAPITKTAQVAKCGNSVCPPLAEALVRANMGTSTPAAQEAQAA